MTAKVAKTSLINLMFTRVLADPTTVPYLKSTAGTQRQQDATERTLRRRGCGTN